MRRVEPAKVVANETLRRRQVELGMPPGERLPFLCECDDQACRAIIRLTADEYRTARAGTDRCVVVEAHPCRGRVVLKGEGFLVAEKDE
jgi:hypothetical protein